VLSCVVLTKPSEVAVPVCSSLLFTDQLVSCQAWLQHPFMVVLVSPSPLPPPPLLIPRRRQACVWHADRPPAQRAASAGHH
jgi:hypothetical protein